MKKGTLITVGTGIKVLSQVTQEAKFYIKNADFVLYLVNEPVMKKWISNCNPKSESLDEIYKSKATRAESYQAICEYVLKFLRLGLNVCFVLYGHPTVFADPALLAIKKATKEGFIAKALPGISAESCLFADLLIDPGTFGCHSFEATDFLLHNRAYDTSGHMILWQIGVIGRTTHVKENKSGKGIRLLVKKLVELYSSSHSAYIYEAAIYPNLQPRIDKVKLEQLHEVSLSRLSTLYLPPKDTATLDETLLEELKIS